ALGELESLFSHNRAQPLSFRERPKDNREFVTDQVVRQHARRHSDQLSFHELVAHVTATDRLRKPYEIFHRQMRFGCHGLSSSLKPDPSSICQTRRLERQACVASAPLTAIAPGHRAEPRWQPPL